MDPAVGATVRAGLVGLGAMGHQMARHIAGKGFPVTGYDVSADANARAAQAGIAIAREVGAVGTAADVVVVMVATDAQVGDVVAGPGGLLETMTEGSVVCIAASVAPETCRELEAKGATRGIAVLDTPVVLGQEAADEGTLVVFVGGEEGALEVARPVLAAFSRSIVHVGPTGAGQIAKTCNNMLLWACMCANWEALNLGKRLGADIPKLLEALNQSSGANWSLSRWGRSTAKWTEKDMDVALDLAQDAKLPLPLAALVDQLMKGMDREKMRSVFD